LLRAVSENFQGVIYTPRPMVSYWKKDRFYGDF